MDGDEGIDFQKLEKEFNLAVEADEKYKRENAAKFRAVEQRVGSYEEFKDIVAASHLKPLEKKDKIDQKKMKQPWNCLASKKTDIKTQISSSSVVSRSSELQLTPHNFLKTWKHELKICQDKYHYLCKVGGVNLGKIFKNEISMGLLGEFLEVLEQCHQKQDTEIILDLLWHLSTTKRFNLSLDFLSSKEKGLLQDLFQHLNHLINDSGSQDYINSKDKLQELLSIYKINL
ncbi:coiled-coil domain-containing protein 103-like [Actinia tenebrosa]|uniref:Coiled-coil domain-containing protein 103-like n=1 Tax=Actinia tenebrosa TaxID=6105 RepID=A0A6P8J1F7_ACTTE|nr:coiled-coil domain-containing protein 103-like [Actinia tenebrosa]